MILKILRNGVGSLIIFASWLNKPKSVERSPEQQHKAQEAMQGLALYQLYACPFCVKTRRALKRLNVDMDIRDVGKQQFRSDLEQGGGKVQVPCLRIEEEGEVSWLYESNDIVRFLEQRTAA